MKDAVVGFFRIGSPSKLMRDEVGVHLFPGVAEGIPRGVAQAVFEAERGARKVSEAVVIRPAADLVASAPRTVAGVARDGNGQAGSGKHLTLNVAGFERGLTPEDVIDGINLGTALIDV